MKFYLFRCKGRRQLFGATRYETGSNLPTDQCIGGWEFMMELVHLTGSKLPKYEVDVTKLRRAVQQHGLYVWEERSAAPGPAAVTAAPPQLPAPIAEVAFSTLEFPVEFATVPVAPPPSVPVAPPPPVPVAPPPPAPIAPPPPEPVAAPVPPEPEPISPPPPVRPAAPPPRPVAAPPPLARPAAAPPRATPVAAPSLARPAAAPPRPAPPPVRPPVPARPAPSKPVPVAASPSLVQPAATPPSRQHTVTPRPAHQVVWFDIPVRDLDRAVRFYSAVLGAPLETMQAGFRTSMSLALLPHAEGAITGCLVQTEDAKPSDGGTLIYLNADGRLDEAVEATEANGGSVVQPKHSIGAAGFRAIVIDSEGNRIALHSS